MKTSPDMDLNCSLYARYAQQTTENILVDWNIWY